MPHVSQHLEEEVGGTVTTLIPYPSVLMLANTALLYYCAMYPRYLEEELGDTETYLETRKPPMRHVPPFRWFLKPWPMGRQFLLQCKKVGQGSAWGVRSPPGL